MGSNVSQHWAVRLTTDEEIPIHERLEGKFTWLAYVVEFGKTSGNRHYHVAITLPTPKADNYVRKQLFGFFTLKGKKSLKVWDGEDGYIRYMHKENTPQFHGTRLGVLSHEDYSMLEKSWREDNVRQRKIDLIDGVYLNLSIDEEFKNAIGQPKLDFWEIKKMVLEEYMRFVRLHHQQLKSKQFIRNDIDNILFKFKLKNLDDEYIKEVLRF